MLGIDLNTLLAFQDDLSEDEIGLFMNYLAEISFEEGIESAFKIANEKINEYPNSDVLVLNVATILKGILVMNGNVEENEYLNYIESLFRRAMESENSDISNQAKTFLISKYRERKEYDKAQALIDTLPNKDVFDKKQIQANLWIEKGKLKEAAEILENSLIELTNDLHTILMSLMEIAIKEKRDEDALYIAKISSQSSKLFDLWEYNTYVPYFQLYSLTKQKEKISEMIIPMFESMAQPWNIHTSPLYRHIKKKDSEDLGEQFQKTMLDLLYKDEDLAYLKDDPKIMKALENL